MRAGVRLNEITFWKISCNTENNIILYLEIDENVQCKVKEFKKKWFRMLLT